MLGYFSMQWQSGQPVTEEKPDKMMATLAADTLFIILAKDKGFQKEIAKSAQHMHIQNFTLQKMEASINS